MYTLVGALGLKRWIKYLSSRIWLSLEECYRPHWGCFKIDSGNGLVPSRNQLFPRSMLTQMSPYDGARLQWIFKLMQKGLIMVFVVAEFWWTWFHYSGVTSALMCLISHYCDVIMGAVTSQITSLTIVYSTVYSDADQRKQQSSASLAFVRGIHRRPVNSPRKWPVTRKKLPFDDIIMTSLHYWLALNYVLIYNKTGLGLAGNRWTHWGRDKMADIYQTTFSFAFFFQKIYEMGWGFHWNLFLRFQWTIFQHWFR